jgi:hypothetical protein
VTWTRTTPIRAAASAVNLRALWLAVALSLLSGCDAPKTAGPNRELPKERLKLSDLRTPQYSPDNPAPDVTVHSRELPGPLREPSPTFANNFAASVIPALPAPPPKDDQPARATGPVVVQVLVMPRNDPRLALALTMLEDMRMDVDLQHLWRDNGFRAGRIDRGKLALMLANMPKPLNVTVFRMEQAQSWTPLTLVDRIRGSQRIAFIGPGPQTIMHRFASGEYQFLMKVTPPLAGSTPSVDILPHHYGATVSLVPRNPQSKVFDGTTFEDLRISRPLPEEQMWVFTAEAPPEAAEEIVSEPDADEAKKPGEEAKPAPRKPAVLNLANAMLTGNRGSKPVQLVVIVGTEKK